MKASCVESADVGSQISVFLENVVELNNSLRGGQMRLRGDVLMKSHEERLKIQRAVITCFGDANQSLQNINLDTEEILMTDNWSELIEEIQDGIESAIIDILLLNIEESELREFAVSPKRSIRAANALLRLKEYFQRLYSLQQYFSVDLLTLSFIHRVYDANENIIKKLQSVDEFNPKLVRINVWEGSENNEGVYKEISSIAEKNDYTEQDIDEHFSDSTARIIIIEYEDDIIGFCLFKTHEDRLYLQEPAFNEIDHLPDLKRQAMMLLRNYVCRKDETISDEDEDDELGQDDNKLFYEQRHSTLCEELRITLGKNGSEALRLLQSCGFTTTTLIEGYDANEYVMGKIDTPEVNRHKVLRDSLTRAIENLMQIGDFEISEPNGFQS